MLPRSLVEPIEEPGESVLKTWFDERKATYAAPEYRKIAYIKLDPEALADPSAISDEQVKKDYDEHVARYTTPETRKIEQLVFATPEAAKTAYDSTRTGATFEDLVKAAGKTMADVQLGTFAKAQVPDPAIAEALFKLAANEVSQPVTGSFGTVLLRVTEIKPEVVKPLTEVADEIRKQLAVAEATRILLDAHDSYEDARAGGATLAEAAAKLNLKVVTVDAIDRQALRPDGKIVDDLPESSELLKQAFETEVGIENPAINIGSTGYVFYEVQDITPARDRTLDEVHDKVVADWKSAEAEKRLDAKAAELAKQVKDGAALDTVAAELKLEKQTKRGVKREADDADFGKEGVAAMFGVAEGGSGVVPSPGGDGRIIFKVAEVFEPAGAGPDAVPEDARKSFASGPFRRSARPAGGAAADRVRRDHRPERDPAGAGFLTGDERAQGPYRQGRVRQAAHFRRGALGVRHDHVRRGDAQPDRRVPDGAARARRDRRRNLRRGRHDAREDAEGRSARRRHRHRRHRRRRLAQRQHLDGLGLRDRRRRRAGRQARQSRPVLADRRRRRADRARRQDRHCARSDRPLHPRGRRRLHVRAGASSGHAPCRPDARSKSARARSSTCSGRCPTRPASSGRWSACSRPNGSSRSPRR